MGESLTLNSAHNFGVYTKSGKRTVFQIDFSCKRISLIERGKFSKTYEFLNLEQYDSEDNLHIAIRFHNNKLIEFDADTAEEKYTICRLLGIILGSDQDDSNDAGVRRNPADVISTKRQVIKEGVLEKKGNTKIPTWSKRRLQVCPGEFSYYKPGDEVALNLVQLWENSTSVTPSGTNTFVVSVRDRSYYFKLLEKGMNTELERDNWIRAFQQASQRKRATFLLLEMSKSPEYINHRQGTPLPTIPSEDVDEISYYNQNTSRSTMSSSGSESSREMLEGLESSASSVINELDEVLNEESAGDARRNISLSVVQKNSPVLVTPAKGRARPPAFNGAKESFKFDDRVDEQATYDFIPEPDYSPPPSPTNQGRVDFKSGFGGIDKDKTSSGIYRNVIAKDDSTNAKVGFGNRVSGKYNQVIRTDPPNTRTSGEYTKAIRPAPGAVNVMSNFTEIPKLRKLSSKDIYETEDSNEKSNSADKVKRNSISEVQSSGTDNKTPVKQMQANIYMNESKDISRENNEKLPSPRDKVSPRDKTKFPLPAPSGHRRAPPPPPVNTVPPPPPMCAPAPPALPTQLSTRQPKGKLKQVHWVRTPKPLIQHSIWERTRDVTPKLNLRLLEDQFAVKEREAPPTPGPKSPGANKQQLLVDAKRAQILDIFMSGLKNEGTRKLVDVLNSVTEDDSFPAEKLNTIRRYQPSEDEIDMYRAYADKKHELHPVDQFMLELCEIPCLSIRIDICLTLWEFPWQFESTCQLVDQVHAACDELLNSQVFVYVLEYLLAIGNHLNRNWSEGNITSGFQITSLDKILSIRGKDTGYMLIHFLVEQLRMSDPGLLQWTETVQMVKKCEQISVKSVAAESEVLKCDLSKVKKHLKTLKAQAVYCSRQDNKFQQDAQNLTVEYEMKLEKLDRRAGELHNKYRKILTRYGEPLYQKSDQLFAIVASFADKFKSAIKDIESKTIERKTSA